MKIRYFLFGLLLMGFSSSGWSVWLNVNSPIIDQAPIVDVQSTAAATWQMEVSIPGFSLETSFVDGQTYDRISLPMEMMAGGDGEAELPVISRLIALRLAGNPEIEIVGEEWMELEGTYDLALDTEVEKARELAAAYVARDEYLPQASFYVTPRQVMGGVSLAVVHIRAAKYNPAQKKIKVLRSAEILVHENGPMLSYARPITETTASILRAVVPNWEDMALDAQVVRGSYLYVLADTTLEDDIEDLVTWRTRKGYTVEVAARIRDIASWSTVGIKDYIQGRYDTADPPLEFVCLLGDESGPWSVPTYTQSGGVGDWNYSRLDGTDYLPDIHIGRFCFDTDGELAVIVSKTCKYEQDPVDTLVTGGKSNWYQGAACFAGEPYLGYGISLVQTMRWIRERMLEVGYPSSSIDTVYYIHETVDDGDITSSINSGTSLFCYRGGYHMETYTQSDIDQLTNYRRLPFMATVCCATNSFNYDSGMEAICELLLKAGSVGSPKGVIGAIGTSSIYTHTRYNNCLIAGVMQGFLREGIHTLGGSLSRSKVELYLNYPVDPSDVADFCHYESLIGDPAVDVFTDTPETLFVDNPSSIPIGTNTLTFTVTNESSQPVEDVYLNLVKGSEVFMGDWTDASGQVVFNFETTTAGTLLVTATKHNHRPAIDTTLVSTSSRFVSPASSIFTIDDDNSGESMGDDDGMANPGETVEVAVDLKNWGTLTAYSVDAELSLSDPYLISINDNSETYGDIGPEATVSPPDDFDFTIASYAPDGYVLQFALTVTDNVPNTWISTVPISLSNGNLDYYGYSLSGAGNGILDPGESGQIQMRLNNIGTRGTQAGTVAYLRSGNVVVSVTDSVGIFSASTAGGQCDNYSDPFGISASNSAFPGERIPLTCIFPLANGFADTVTFNLYIGSIASNTPTPPDSYGYWAFDDTDVAYDKHPTYSWVEIDDREGGSGTPLSIIDNADEDDETVVVTLPFAFKYYGQDYTQISVCSNGWLAMGADQVVHETFRNRYIPGALGPEAMIAPFWDDLWVTYSGSGGRVYTYHDAANHRFIIEWSRVDKYDGVLPYPEETFECILYEPGYPATPTGDGEILFQYMTCNNTPDISTSNNYATVGIENLTETDGVLYSFFAQADPDIPGAAPMTHNRAILFTTQKLLPSTPKAPTNLTTIRSGNDIELRWNGVYKDIYENPITVSGYKIYRSDDPMFTPSPSDSIGVSADSIYADVGAALASKYFYVVQAYVLE